MANKASHGDGYYIAASSPYRSRACWLALKVLLNIHTVVENSDDNDPGFRTGSVKDNMTTLTELFCTLVLCHPHRGQYQVGERAA